MKYPVYNQSGKEEGSMVLPKEIFEVPMNADLVHQVFVSQTSNMRQNSAHTKNRGEVRGGGRKPWRQKGTGRARHGSTRSPIWVGGGVSGGPRNERNYKKDIPKTMKRKALFMVLSEKAKNNFLVVIDKMDVNVPKTRKMAEMIKKLPVCEGSRLVAYESGNGKVFLAARNIVKTGVLEIRNLNLVDLLNYKYLLTTKEGIKEIEKVFFSNQSRIKSQINSNTIRENSSKN